MRVDETEIVYNKENPQVPMLLYRSGQNYFLHDHCNSHMPLRQIPTEEAWNLLGVAESMRKIMRGK